MTSSHSCAADRLVSQEERAIAHEVQRECWRDLEQNMEGLLRQMEVDESTSRGTLQF